MTKNKIKLSGMFDLEIEVPDDIVNKFAAAMRVVPTQPASNQPSQAEDAQPAFPDTQNGRQASAVADYLKEAGKDGVTEQQIRNRFPAIRSAEHLASVLSLLPKLLYRSTKDKATGQRHWTHFYAQY